MAKLPIIESLRTKITQIISQNKSLQLENKKLQEANQRLREKNKTLSLNLDTTRKRISLLELSKGFQAASSDNKQAKARVNQLMREVDKCIAMLNNE